MSFEDLLNWTAVFRGWPRNTVQTAGIGLPGLYAILQIEFEEENPMSKRLIVTL
jgi:hypothetical protein